MIASASRTSGLDIPFLEMEPVTRTRAHESYPDLAPLEPGALIAERYRVLRKIGEGGMGVLYACEDTVLARQVAVKLMQRSLAAEPELAERLLREARLAAQLHTHVAQVFDCGTLSSGAPYIVMELLSGRDLYSVLRDSGPLSPDELARDMLEVCVGLGEAHDKDIIHRDLKPENLFCATEPDGSTQLKIVDFGISKQTRSRSMRSLTNPTESVGSPQYMSPEQITSPTEVDARTDIWSLGVVMFELLTGAAPFNGPNPAQVCAAVLTEPVPQFSDYRRDVPPALQAIVLRCLEKEREQRFGNVAELAAALSAFSTSVSPHSPGWRAGSSFTRDSVDRRGRRRWAGAFVATLVFGACAAVLGVAVRDGRMPLPTRAQVLHLTSRVSAWRIPHLPRALGH